MKADAICTQLPHVECHMWPLTCTLLEPFPRFVAFQQQKCSETTASGRSGDNKPIWFTAVQSLELNLLQNSEFTSRSMMFYLAEKLSAQDFVSYLQPLLSVMWPCLSPLCLLVRKRRKWSALSALPRPPPPAPLLFLLNRVAGICK